MGDASSFITTSKSIAIGRGIIGTAGKPHNVSAAVQLSANRFQINSTGRPVSPPSLPPVTSITGFTRTNLAVGDPLIYGSFTKDNLDSTSLEWDVNFTIYRVIVEPTTTYNFILTPLPGSDPDLYLSFQDTAFTQSNVVDIANDSWSRSSPSTSFVYLRSENGRGSVDSLQVVTTAAGFFDVLVLSYRKGGWSFDVTGNI